MKRDTLINLNAIISIFAILLIGVLFVNGVINETKLFLYPWVVVVGNQAVNALLLYIR